MAFENLRLPSLLLAPLLVSCITCNCLGQNEAPATGYGTGTEEVEYIPLKNGNAEQIESALKRFFPDSVFSGTVDSKGLLFRGASEQERKTILRLVERMDERSDADSDKRVYGGGYSTSSNLEIPRTQRAAQETDLAASPEYPKEELSPQQQLVLFQMRRDLLRQRIAVQRKKLNLLEQQLLSRTQEFLEIYEAVKTTVPVEDKGNNQALELETEELLEAGPDRAQIRPHDVQEVQTAEPADFLRALPQEDAAPAARQPLLEAEDEEEVDAQNIPMLPELGFRDAPVDEPLWRPLQEFTNLQSPNASTEDPEGPVLPAPREEEQAYAAAIRQFGGFYSLNDEGYIETVNMVYHEDDDGTRYDNRQRENQRVTRYLPKLKFLRKLYLCNGQVSDDTMRFIAECEGLEVFFVWDARKVSDEGIKLLANLEKLQNIHISSAGITDDALEVLAQLPAIERLSLQQNNFADQGLRYLSESENLVSVWVGLGESNFSDAAIREMLKVETLEQFGFQGSAISQETVDLFEEAGVELINPKVAE